MIYPGLTNLLSIITLTDDMNCKTNPNVKDREAHENTRKKGEGISLKFL